MLGIFLSLEFETCKTLEAALDKAGSLDIPSLLSKGPLTSLNTTLNNFIQNISNGDVTSEEDITRFVYDLKDSINDVIIDCDIDASLLDNNTINNLLQELLNGLNGGEEPGCVAVADFLANDLVFRADRGNLNALNDFLTIS